MWNKEFNTLNDFLCIDAHDFRHFMNSTDTVFYLGAQEKINESAVG